MKKIFAFIIVLLYMATTSGFVFNVHYCKGKISSVKVSIAAKNLCGCGKNENKGCCKTEQKVVKLNDNHKSTVQYFFIQKANVAVCNNSFYTANLGIANNINCSSYCNFTPPLLNKQNTYLLNCVFRI